MFMLQNKSLDYLGKISYGIYMFHCLCIAIAFYIINRFSSFSPSTAGNAIAYALIFGLTILIAAISYRWIEKPFIQKKYRFGKFASSDSD